LVTIHSFGKRCESLISDYGSVGDDADHQSGRRMNYILTIWKIFDDEFLIGNGLRLICAALDYDPEKIGKHMLEMLAKFRNEGIIE
jgi:hypothetical protein